MQLGFVLQIAKHQKGIHVSKDKSQTLHFPLVRNEII